MVNARRTGDASRRAFEVRAAALGIVLAATWAAGTVRAEIVGASGPVGFSLCEERTDDTGAPRPECQASDLRFQGSSSAESEFGFAVAVGHLNGDDREDLVVSDPTRNRVYVFFGRASSTAAYGLAADSLDRGVVAESKADVVLAAAAPVGSFGFSVAIGRERIAETCGTAGAAALVIGAPGQPGTSPNAPGTVFYLPAGALCRTPSDPAVATTIDPATIGQAFSAPDAAQDDEFGYAVALGRISAETGTDEDVIVGARGAAEGAGRVTIFPVADRVVQRALDRIVRVEGTSALGLGEVLAVGDLDLDFNADTVPFGGSDDFAVGGVGAAAGKVLFVRGPLSSTGGPDGDGVYREGEDERLRSAAGEADGDFFGFSVAIGASGRLAIGAIYADNLPPDGTPPGSTRTNVRTGARTNAGKVYVWNAGDVFTQDLTEITADTADTVLVARRSGDQLGFGLGFGNLNRSGVEDLVVSARRHDGNGVEVDRIDQGVVYVFFDSQFGTSPVDLNPCASNSECIGAGGADAMIFGGDRAGEDGDEIGFALALGDSNGDGTDDLLASSITHTRAYVVTLDDADKDRADEGRNIRDDDDDNDDDSDAVDCRPLDATINSEADEITCNGIDENCNGAADDAPDADGDGVKACRTDTTPADCDDADPTSFPGATEVCDGNDNDCSGQVPTNERDSDGDGYVACSEWADPQGDNASILGGGDCAPTVAATYPGAAPLEADAAACMKDADGDDYGDAAPPSGVTAGTDCDDRVTAGAATFPGSAPRETNPGACRKDTDGDDYGDATPPSGVTAGTDCADGDATSHPQATEVCDGNDNDCAGGVPNDEKDADRDGFAVCAPWNDSQKDNPAIAGGGDCVPDNPAIFPGAASKEAIPTACMKDADGDEYGDIQPPAGVTAGTDCNDAAATGGATFPGAAPLDSPLACMKDGDGDDYGDAAPGLPVVAGTDCDDANAARHVGRAEIPDDGVDQDCSGTDTITCYVDADGDGFGTTTSLLAPDGDCTDAGEAAASTDCDDDEVAIFPGAADIPGDGIDQDCNGSDSILCYEDADRDGHGTTAGTRVVANDGACDAEDGESTTFDDCDDADPTSFPGATEVCDGNDNDCDGTVPPTEEDNDGDRFVECSVWVDTQGDDPTILAGGDCNDASSVTYPGAAEKEPLASACMKDKDGDGFGDVAAPAGVARGTDCDDDSPLAASTFPGAAPADAPLNCMRDVDGDDHGDAAAALPVVPGTDCNDADPTTFGGAPERCDGDDNACSGSIPAEEADGDGDGFVVCGPWSDTQGDNPGILGGGDCAPADPATFPGAAARESFPAACLTDKDGDGFGDLTPAAGVAAGTDCDDDSPTAASTYPGAASIDGPLNCMKDADGDEYGDAAVALPVVRGRDCDDARDSVNPSSPEGPQDDPVCSDGLDNDCDGFVDDADPVCQGIGVACPDADRDGFAECASDPNCDPAGLTCGDCDDAEPAVRPNAIESCNGRDDDCDVAVDEGFDADDDGFSTCDQPIPDCDDVNPAVNPGVAEVCGDGIDNDCRAATADLFDGDGDGAACDVDCNDGDPALNLVDGDGDGSSTCTGECNDANPAIRPGVPDVCNDGIDNDCDPATLDVRDGDGDGASCIDDCDDANPVLNLLDADDDNVSTCEGDCNDGNASIKPGAVETCNGADDDCDGTIDDPFDQDGDGYTTCGEPVADCNDTDPRINPGAAEVCGDGINNDCNAATPDVVDGDGDGASCAVDCDDADPLSRPGAVERCDGNDNACTGTVSVSETDPDGDGFVACAAWSDPQGDNPAILGGGDCAPTDPQTFPGAASRESFPTACMTDKDGDGYGDLTPAADVVAGTDCDDDSEAGATTYPGAAAIDGPLNCMKDADGDDYGDAAVGLPVVPGTDCDDTSSSANPGITEGPAGSAVCSDTIDNDCDGQVDASDSGCTQLLRSPVRRKAPTPAFRTRRGAR